MVPLYAFFSAAFYVHKLMFGTFYKCFMSTVILKKETMVYLLSSFCVNIKTTFTALMLECAITVTSLLHISEMPTS